MIINIRYNRLILCSVTSRYLFECCRVFNILYTVFAQNDAPVGFSFCWICRNYLFIKLLCFIELIFHTKVVGTVEIIGQHIIVTFRNRLFGSAIFALTDGHTLCYFKRTSAHFTLEYCHNSYPLLFILHASFLSSSAICTFLHISIARESLFITADSSCVKADASLCSSTAIAALLTGSL